MKRVSRLLIVILAITVPGLAACGAAAPELEPPGSTGSGLASSGSSPASDSPAPRKAGVTPATSEAHQSALDEQLRDAAWANDVDRAAALIERGADVNAKDATEQSPYLISASEGYLDLLNLTLAHGARVDSKDSWNGTALIRAAERGHALVVGRLLQVGIDKDHVNRIGYQAIHEAVWLGADTTSYVDTIRVLAAGGVELTRESGNQGLTPLQMAQQRRYPDVEAALIGALRPARVQRPRCRPPARCWRRRRRPGRAGPTSRSQD